MRRPLDQYRTRKIAAAAIAALWALALCLAAPGLSQAAELTPGQIANRRCLNCHAQAHIGELEAQERAGMVATPLPPDSPAGPRPELAVDLKVMGQGVHGGLACVDCHRDAVTLPHAARLEAAVCQDACHATAATAYRRSAHAQARAAGDAEAPTCADCHGDHHILPPTERDALTHPLNVVAVCADCHQSFHRSTPDGQAGDGVVASYLESVHGRAVTESGLLVAATCADCHQAHEVLPSDDPASSVHRQHVPQTCGQCHLGITEVYLTSIHGQKLQADDPDAPVCSDCHTAHAITRASTPGFLQDIVSECGQCHDRPPAGSTGRSLYQTYRESYHGQVTQLGSTRAARCSDCHGAHNILPASDPRSRIHPDNRVDACRPCHASAGASFVQYLPHADHRDASRFPLLHGVWTYFILVMTATFSFFGLHTLLWFVRGGIERARHGKHHHHAANPHAIKRFGRVDRINHAFVIITFFGLTLTGMPLLFADQDWAGVLARAFGGVHVAGYAHRVFAVMLFINFAVHFGGVVRRVRRSSFKEVFLGPNSMVPRWKDVQDCRGMFRWFLRGGAKPRFDHFTYWEKFDYWAEIFGTAVIGGSGLMLAFPEQVARVLPGWAFNVATIIHGYEALLAVGFIFTIHFFNAHLRVEKFPVDDVMFTGSLPEGEFREERGAEYERLAASGQLESLRVTPPPRWARPLAVAMGLLAMAIGTAMVLLIVLAGLDLI